MSTQTFQVNGMTCGHCTAAVTDELTTLEGVTDVTIDLVKGGTSDVHVVSDRALSREEVAAAVDEAGYELARPGSLPLA
ncbi:heavy-metal-associated domain-containing protein [Aeromicrobium sp. Leaf350]|uniref:heavy-metal-associated domain-containing protein n=1 Tax=Aeromicrobium sp. Leaf350 TaxID=2876565 RepID=UPI001E62CABD|nr:heavy-metal-associated domain-containing protein [Aeromicrobium sp. Leaf350]